MDLRNPELQPGDIGMEYTEEEWEERVERFAEPGGNSALYPATRSNPRNLPCPTCGTPNVLTAQDVARGYQCDTCADRDEGLLMPQ